MTVNWQVIGIVAGLLCIVQAIFIWGWITPSGRHFRKWFRRSPLLPPSVVEEQLRPAEGNIKDIPEERDNPLPDISGCHVFPDRSTPVTRYDDFNARLFVYIIDELEDPINWPTTSTHDFPTFIKAASFSDVLKEVEARLRPRYPVVIDGRGWWNTASVGLEMDPDHYNDAIVESYLALPAEQRPVVVSAAVGSRDAPLTFLRYGFEHFRLWQPKLSPFYSKGLTYTLREFTGPERNWQWFSVARMRQALIRSSRAMREVVEAVEALQREKLKLAHDNRFTALWKTRIRADPDIQETAAETDDASREEAKS